MTTNLTERFKSTVSYAGRHVCLTAFAAISVISVVLYLPALNAYFVSDDFQILTFLTNNYHAFLNGQQWIEWLLGGIDAYLYFRPAGNLVLLMDFLAWGRSPVGYHLANLALQIAASFAVFILGWQLTRNRVTAFAAAILFAAMPVHAEAVSFISGVYNPLAGLFYFAALIFYILYARDASRQAAPSAQSARVGNGRRRRRLGVYALSLAAFALAISAKETAITLPGLLLLYDALFDFKRLLRVPDTIMRHAPFWIVLGLRLTTWQLGYRGAEFIPEGWGYWIDTSLDRLIKPLATDVSGNLHWIIIALAVVVFLLIRSRPLAFALLLIPISLVPTVTSGPSDRSTFVASFGVALAIAIVFTQLASRRGFALQASGVGATIAVAAWYGAALFSLNQAYNRAGDVAYAIPAQVKALHPTLPEDARLVFVGVPDQVSEGPFVYITGFRNAMELEYDNPQLQAFKLAKFPLWLDGLDRTYFFSVDHRKVAERTDLIQALRARKACADFSMPAVTWNFSNDVQGWEAWSQLSDFDVRNGALAARSDGKDPYMASPPIDIPSLSIGDIEIEMSVRAGKPQMQGKAYWLATGQNDFSPALQVPFTVTSDGELHTYRVDLAQSDQLTFEDRIVRLRLDPADDAADIAIKRVQVFTHCSASTGGSCMCAQ